MLGHFIDFHKMPVSTSRYLFDYVCLLLFLFLQKQESLYRLCLMFMPSGPVELLFVLSEMANCSFVVLSSIALVGRFLIVWSMSVFFKLFSSRPIFHGQIFLRPLKKGLHLESISDSTIFAQNQGVL